MTDYLLVFAHLVVADVVCAGTFGQSRYVPVESSGLGSAARLGRQDGEEISCGRNHRKQRPVNRKRNAVEASVMYLYGTIGFFIDVV